MKPFVPVTVIGTLAVPPAVTGPVAEVVAMVKVSVVALTARLTLVVSDPVLVPLAFPVTTIGNEPAAMLAGMKIVSVTFWADAPFTLVGLNVQVPPPGSPAQLVFEKFTVMPGELFVGVTAIVVLTD
jgi:hypothetical protein